MKGAWWVGKDDLDDDQAKVIVGLPDSNFIIIGPPGSGKTNLLLLRANYLHLAGLKNILIIVFTRALRDYIALGGENYDFPSNRVITCMKWEMEFLNENGLDIPKVTDFEERRAAFLKTISDHIETNNINNYYDAILLDEAQDYSLNEIDIFRKLTPRLLMAADLKQKIYDTDSSIDELKEYVDDISLLTYHYRNGEKICQVADKIGEHLPDYSPMTEGSNYDEGSKPSSVEIIPCDSFEEEIDALLGRLDVQLKAYPEELIGIVTFKNDHLETIWRKIQDTKFAPIAALHKKDNHTGFDENTRICVSTTHGAKGLEFIVLNFLRGEHITKGRKQQIKLAFTTVTRCKTSLLVYHSNNLPGYLDSALHVIDKDPGPPALDDVFGVGK